MKRILLLVAVVFMAFSACESNNTSYGSTYEEIQDQIIDNSRKDVLVTDECIAAANITEKMKENAEQYRQSTYRGDGGRNGVYVYSKSVNMYNEHPEQLAARIAVLGFNDVYLSPGKEQITGATPWLRTFIATLKGYGIQTHALRIADNSIYVNEAKVETEVELIKTYNNAVAPDERFYGIAADLEPHTCKGSSKPAALTYEWNSQTGYGVGGANDKLLQLTLERLQKAKGLMTKQAPQLSEAVSYNFQIQANANKLSYGTMPQFLASCDWVVLMSYLGNKEDIWSKSEPSLAAAKEKPQSVSVCVKTAVNNDEGDGLQPKGWQYLLETARYIMEKGKAYGSFRGFDVFNYEGLESMWEKAE